MIQLLTSPASAITFAYQSIDCTECSPHSYSTPMRSLPPRNKLQLYTSNPGVGLNILYLTEIQELNIEYDCLLVIQPARDDKLMQ